MAFSGENSNRDFFVRSIELPVFENPAPLAIEASFADFLYSQGFCNDAADEYVRVSKLMAMESESDYSSYQRAACLIKVGDFARAEDVLDRLGYAALDKEVSYRARHLRALLEVAENSPERADFIISDFLRDFPENEDEILYWRGWFRLLYYDIDGALDDFSAVCNASERNPYYAPRAYGIKRWLDMNRQNVEQRSPYLARWFSGIVPGFGQIYIGDWKQGINSLLINGAFGYLTINALIAKRYIQSATIFILGWNRYYFGGMLNSESSAHKYNERQWDIALKTLMDTFIGVESKINLAKQESDTLPAQEWLNGVSLTAEALLGAYQGVVTGQDAQSCQFETGCSKFSRIAFRTRNPFVATLMTSDRLIRCNPFAKKYYCDDSTGHLSDDDWMP